MAQLPPSGKVSEPDNFMPSFVDAHLFLPGKGRAVLSARPFRFRRHTGFPSRAYQVQRKGTASFASPSYQSRCALFAHVAELYLWDFQG